MSLFFKALGILVIALSAYLSLWPVPLEPVAWDAPKNKGYVGAFSPNTQLAALSQLDIGEDVGPEDVVVANENNELVLYVPVHSGNILRIVPATQERSIIANTKGRPLGIEQAADGTLIVADAYRGLLAVSLSGDVAVLTDNVENTPILYADDLDIAKDGTIYFSDASTRFGAQRFGGTYDASVLEILEHGKTGRLLKYSPQTGITSIVADALSFANGVAMCPDDACVLVNETGTYSIHKYWVAGEKAGTSEIIAQNLPGFPDNINPGRNGTFWVGLFGQRIEVADALSDKPFWRKVIYRLPDFLKPAPIPYTMVIQIDEDGRVLQTLQDPTGAYPAATGAIDDGEDTLFITSLEAENLGYLSLSAKNITP